MKEKMEENGKNKRKKKTEKVTAKRKIKIKQ